jgi:hypothetical protein
MDQIASFLVFMLAAMAIGLSVLVAAVFCIGLCEGAGWIFSRVHPNPVRADQPSALSR